ncbi:bis(5'-nucleosyl)-tetraphosphatase (symmetrical) YqeK [Vagococcus carniphilus]|uniref:bis(5'-nucleosyl)-tetraphosphatase (symmetrical) YqeK n=1 Tax=Vagococcus carniphilus TaxID=218144 RepID=UPI00288C9D94|nr:bis(5'-nucleosyl)-tetraphosphatase (symmetrical) YqeK [Vagococcus carniphilus]MDT2815279.1 bis(5'-nucleosyl)-tetraphosphatase (symmetrical) YqeK [Vagococcus carniphilus]MDT2865350.1 bis(5'-nucleosyl)-tetraphosphatase (symmetrical) YqeK [Vagococcus carniphilus]
MLIENYNITFPKKITSIEDKMFFYFNYFDLEKIAKHSLEVATEAKRLAPKFQIDEEKAYLAALLHDIGNVVPSDKQLLLAKELKLHVVEAEEILPFLLHQKLSAYLAEKIFFVTDQELLSAMACHTTLKAQATDLDKLIFIADKVKWDHSDRAPFLDDVEQALTVSLNQACLVYLEWAFIQGMPVIHPMLQEAYDSLLILKRE